MKGFMTYILTRPIQNPFETMTPKMINYQIIILIGQGLLTYNKLSNHNPYKTRIL